MNAPTTPKIPMSIHNNLKNTSLPTMNVGNNAIHADFRNNRKPLPGILQLSYFHFFKRG